MHHYPRHVGDYRKDTPHLSQAQHGAFTLLLDWYYASEKPLPNDLDLLCRIAAALKTDERKNIETVLGYFFTLEPDNCWHQKRCDKEIAVYQARSNGGKKGMSSRYSQDNPPGNSGSNSPPNSTDNSEDNNQRAREPVTSNQEPVTKEVSGFAFPAEWSEQRRSDVETFITYRRTVLKKPLKPQTFPAWVRKYAEFDDATMRAAINDSMAEGYQGIFPEKHLPRPRREGAWNPTFEKKGGVGPAPAAHPLAVPPCAEWKTIARIVCERAGIEDFTWLDEANWTELASDDRQAVVDEWKYREEARAGGAA